MDIGLAQEAHIDGFVVNFGIHEEAIAKLPEFFTAAEQTGFKLLLSFDYEGAGAWPKERVIEMLNRVSCRAKRRDETKANLELLVLPLPGLFPPRMAAARVHLRGPRQRRRLARHQGGHRLLLHAVLLLHRR